MELLEQVGSPIPLANLILGAIFETAAPPWVQDADELVQSPEELPSDIVSAGAVLGLDADGIYDQLVTSWGKVDAAARERVGFAGEAALVSLLKESADGSVDHVSTWSDGFGYDIAFAQGAAFAHLEVKSTTRTGRFTAYLSRHEYRVMLRDPRWVLVVVRLTADLDIAAVGSVPRDWIAAAVPRDAGSFGSWASCKLELPGEVIEDRVTQLGTDMASRLPPWRTVQPRATARRA
ncbi:protein NO VEIN domain-containing protein [Arthrobacter sp. NPDC056691]|uniref:protein NO VEIN domain-containing protein n=1 Tax=Arthrobacter sp. NPDC056691 TaxID=3345913 RepID=UPI00366BD068